MGLVVDQLQQAGQFTNIDDIVASCTGRWFQISLVLMA
jgi:hypothetical protein